MERENVLELKIVKMNDEYSAVDIAKQDDDVIKRGKFEFPSSNGFVIISELFPYYDKDLKILNIMGLENLKDNKIVIIPNYHISDLENALNELNQKYGNPKHWRNNKHGGLFYSVSQYFTKVIPEFDYYNDRENEFYDSGNYFRTQEQAKECAKRIRKLLKEYHKEIGE